jgi:hypothetical protein
VAFPAALPRSGALLPVFPVLADLPVLLSFIAIVPV